MNMVALWRIMRGCTWKVQRNLLRFAWNGRRAVRAFERRKRRGSPFFPAFLMISITDRCNLRCRGCWVEQTSPGRELSLAQMHRIVTTARRYRSRFFGVLGGEPLLHPGLFELFEQHPEAYFQLFSNGMLLTEEIGARLAMCGNVTPLISLEGLETESCVRRGREDVFARTTAGISAMVKAGLFTGVAASINRRNFDELVCERYLETLVELGVHYIWYFIYRPCGSDPDFGNALDRDQILALRRFLVEQRCRAKLLILDAYWDGLGNAVCPGAMGISHHISPGGAVEFCPIIQCADAFLDENASNLETVLQTHELLKNLRTFCAKQGRGCIMMEKPRELGAFLREQGARDTSGRDLSLELTVRPPVVCHDLPGCEIPEKSLLYRLGKKFYFFGFGAYG